MPDTNRLVILNFSYRADVTADRGDLERLARARGLSLVGEIERPCASWDAPAFHLVKRGGPFPHVRSETQVTIS